MDTSDIGQYGTLRLVKRQDSLSVVASYPIDEESLTFGRDPTCSVRLYYAGVSAVHAKIFFEERKAFLLVMGTNGLLVDGCQVFPAPAGTTTKPTTIPLSNNSEIEIHKKRFVFTYPPKDLRKVMPLISTPSKPFGLNTPGKTAGRTRTLRLSMIQSAQVFTPGPSADPAVNLRILQSPLKPRARSRSPEKMTLTDRLKEARDAMDQDGDEEIVLVDGNYPRVVEEDKDLIILEDVEFEELEPEAQSLMSSFPSPPSPVKSRPDLKLMPAPLPPVTPRRTPSRPSLHKAVLIRSAQRAVMRVEASEAHGGLAHVYEDEDDEEEEEERHENDIDVDMEREDDEEEDSEAAEVAAAIAESSFSSGSGADDNDEDDDDDELQHDERNDEDEDEGEEGIPAAKPSSLWRKSLETLTWPFRAGSREAEEQQDVHDHALEVPEEVNASDEDKVESQPVEEDEVRVPPQAPATPHQVRRPLGNFMTPQPFAARGSAGIGGGRYSMAGGTGPRRVKMEPTWKVRDIVVPLRADDEKEEANGEEGGAMTVTPRRARLSDEERKAIQDRRRSALTAPDTFFGGQAPGLGRLSTSPIKNTSPYKPQVQHQIQGDDEEDTRALLERMKETVEGMKRRRSLAPANTHSAGIFGLGDTPIDIDETSTEEGREPEANIKGETESENEEMGLRSANSEDEVSEGEGSDKENASDHPISDAEEHDQAPQADPIHPPRTPHLDLKQVAHGLNATKTPSFKGVRELFKDKADLPKTPHMDGMRHLFRQREALATPSFEGVGEMMSTPPGWKEHCTEEQEEEMEESEEEEVKPILRVRSKPASSTSAAKPASKEAAAPTTRRKTPRAAAVKTPVTEGRSNFADDEATPGDNLARVQEEDEDGSAGQKPTVKRGRSRAASADSDAEESAPAKPKARLVRGSKKVVPDIAEEPVELPKPTRSRTTRGADVEKAEDVPARKTRTPAARAGSHAPDSEGSSKPVKRTTKTSIKPESSTGEASRIAAPPKPIRKPVSRTLKSAATVTESEPEPAKKTPAARKGRTATKTPDDEPQPAVAAPSKKVTRGKAAEVEDPDEDPLDSNNTPDEPVAAAPAKRAARSRTVTAETAAATSTRKAPVKKVATKAGPAKKAAATPTVASGDSEEDVNKENTPSKEDEEAAKLKKPTRTRKIVKEEADLEVELPKPRATRATRSKQ